MMGSEMALAPVAGSAVDCVRCQLAAKNQGGALGFRVGGLAVTIGK